MTLLRLSAKQGVRLRVKMACCQPHPRYLSTRSKLFQVAEEVEEALQTGKPVVALESTIYTHGYPYPENVALSSLLESLVRTHGGVPATIGIVDGVARIGMDPDMLIRLVSTAGSKDTWKISRRDLGLISGLGLRGQRLNGGTTIAGTMLLAHLAGIKVFATGGLGGVHRGGENSMDVSADLTELGRTPVAVVSSGCKSFLDIPRTLEFLETQGVGVGTFADGRQGAVDFPGFFSRDSGVRSPQTILTEADAAAIIHAQFQFPIHSGLLFANPVPADVALSKEEMDVVLEQAVREAEEEGISGSANTPFVLKRIKELTKGKTIQANSALIEANVIRGTKVAVELAKLELTDREGVRNGTDGDLASSAKYKSETGKGVPLQVFPKPERQISSIEEVDLVVAGALACDTICDYNPFKRATDKSSPELHTSNPAIISQFSGGVGRNVAVAAHYSGSKVALASVVADDIAGKAVIDQMDKAGMSTSDILQIRSSEGARTAQYLAVNDSQKDLVLAMGDFSIFQRPELESKEYWTQIFSSRKPKWIVIDSNWTEKVTRSIIEAAQGLAISIALEPVSTAKAERMFDAASGIISTSSVLPRHMISLATPNKMELEAMHRAARNSGLFESEQWWQVIDEFSLSSSGLKDKMTAMTAVDLVTSGVLQQSLQLLPFIPNLITKLGPKGCLLTSVLRKGDERLTDPDSAPYVLSRSTKEDSLIGGIYVRHFSPAGQIRQEDIVSVNGVGDTLLGVLMGGIVRASKNKKQPKLEDLIPIAQQAAVLTLQSKEAVSPRIQELQPALQEVT